MKYSMPAEWEKHDACWIAWPSHADLWEEDLPHVQKEVAALCRAIAFAPPGGNPEKLEVLAPNPAMAKQAAQALEGLPHRIHPIAFGDVWLRDTGPIFLFNDRGQRATASFRFNGWGGKYLLPHDAQVSTEIAKRVEGPRLLNDWVLEGGSIEVDGEGTCLTTEQCLLNPNRNPGLSKAEIERHLKDSLGVQTVLWLGDGLLNDHTDGHIDTIARFVAPGKVVCMAPSGADDPNTQVLRAIETRLRAMQDARGRKLEVFTVPSPGLVKNEGGKVMPASYVNFYLSNHSVVIPTYASPYDRAAVEAIGKLFPGRVTQGLSARALLTGGGAFHCITQQQPAEGAPRG